MAKCDLCGQTGSGVVLYPVRTPNSDPGDEPKHVCSVCLKNAKKTYEEYEEEIEIVKRGEDS